MRRSGGNGASFVRGRPPRFPRQKGRSPRDSRGVPPRGWMTAAPFRRRGRASQHHEPSRAQAAAAFIIWPCTRSCILLCRPSGKKSTTCLPRSFDSVTFSLLSVSSVKSGAIFPCVTISAFWLHVVESLVQVNVDIERRAAQRGGRVVHQFLITHPLTHA